MGIKDFTKVFTEDCIVGIEHLKGKRIAVDAMTEIHAAVRGSAHNTLTDKDGNSTMYINVIMAAIVKFIENNITTIWVFDYEHADNEDFHNPAKMGELIKRKLRREHDAEEIENLTKKLNDTDISDDEDGVINRIEQLKKRAVLVTKEMLNTIKFILNCLCVEYVIAPAGFEGEAICAILNESGHADAVYSADTDSIPFGALTWYRRNRKDKGEIYKYTQQNILRQIKSSTGEVPKHFDIIKICTILGCDFTEKTRGVGAKTVLRKYKNIKLSPDQIKACRVFINRPDEDIQIKNYNPNNIPAFYNPYYVLLIDYLVDVRGFNRTRVTNWIKKIQDIRK